jgi:hypothetical protein
MYGKLLTYWVDLEIPWLARLVKVYNDFLVR